MINILISVGAAVIIALIFKLALGVALWISIPFGVIVGVLAFVFLARKIQESLEGLMNQVQKEIQANKLERAIETLKSGYALKNRHIFVEAQINSQIGMLYYLKKDNEKAFTYLQKGFPKHFIAQCMLAVLYYKRKDYDAMKKALDVAVQSNKKESICYAVYAYLLEQNKERELAVSILQKGLDKLPNDERLKTNLTLLQNGKKLKMKVYGEMWLQFMLERPPRIVQQPNHPQMRYSKRDLFR